MQRIAAVASLGIIAQVAEAPEALPDHLDRAGGGSGLAAMMLASAPFARLARCGFENNRLNVASGKESIMPTAGPPTTIMIVEDEPLVRMCSADILENAGYVVIEAADADQAIVILNKRPEVHLLFSDVDRPGSMDGLDLANLVHERWPEIRLLLTSGNHRLAKEQMPESGEFLPKPCKQDVLIACVRQILG
jgi:CheY-like chemotaxis protein